MADKWPEDNKRSEAADHQAERRHASETEPDETSWVDELFAERSRQRADVLGNKPGADAATGTHETAAAEAFRDDPADENEGDTYRGNNHNPDAGSSFYGRLMGEVHTARENPYALLELLPFGAFLLFVLISLVLGVLSYNTMQRLDELEQANTALTATVSRLSTQLEQAEAAPVAASGAEQIDQQWVVDRIIEQTEPLEKHLAALEGRLQQWKVNVSARPPVAAPLPATKAEQVKAVPSNSSGEGLQNTGQPPAIVEQPAQQPLLLTPKLAAGENAPGEWIINLVSLSTREAIERLRTRYQREGIAVQLQTTEVNGKTIYRLRVPGFRSREEADRYAGTIKQKLGLDNIWITQN